MIVIINNNDNSNSNQKVVCVFNIVTILVFVGHQHFQAVRTVPAAIVEVPTVLIYHADVAVDVGGPQDTCCVIMRHSMRESRT